MALKRSKFTDNIILKNFTDTFYQNTDKFQKRGGEGVYTPHLSSPCSAHP